MGITPRPILTCRAASLWRGSDPGARERVMDEYESPVVEQGVWTRHQNGDVTYYPPGGAPPGPDYVGPQDDRATTPP